MRTIAHRELRNQSAKILDAVEHGETIQVTNNGRIVAVLVPPKLSPVERGRLSGTVISPKERILVSDLPRVRSDQTVIDVLTDLKGDR